jgi:hypothetical protein
MPSINDARLFWCLWHKQPKEFRFESRYRSLNALATAYFRIMRTGQGVSSISLMIYKTSLQVTLPTRAWLFATGTTNRSHWRFIAALWSIAMPIQRIIARTPNANVKCSDEVP